MSTCAHENFMSMLMKLPCALARGGVTRTTTFGQYASSTVSFLLTEGLLVSYELQGFLKKLNTLYF